MKTHVWIYVAIMLLASACGDKNSNDDNVIPGNAQPNNETNNGSNNTTGSNNGSNNGTNGSNNGTNGSNNGTNGSNNGTNGSNNGTNGSNNGTNNMTQGPGEVGTATVDIAITVNSRTTQMTECEWMNESAQAISYVENAVDGSIVGRLACIAPDPENINGSFVLEIQMLDSSVGTNAATTMFIECDQDGCSGNAEILVGYYDLSMNVSEEVSTTNSMDEGGNMVISAFDPATGEVEGELNAVIREGGTEATLVGTFSADLADCTDRDSCVGDGN